MQLQIPTLILEAVMLFINDRTLKAEPKVMTKIATF